MFAKLISRWRGLPWWGRVVIIVVLAYAVAFLIISLLGAGNWGQAQAATAPRPTKAWLVRGKIASVQESAGSVAITSRSRHVTCAQQYARKTYRNIFHQELIWLKMTKSWCYARSNHEVTQQPLALVVAGTSTLGALTQWKIDPIDNRPSVYYPYASWEKGGSRSWAAMQASRCFPTPLGCIQVGSTAQTIEILGHFDGSYSLY